MPITQIPFQDPVAPPEKPQPEQLGLYDAQGWETAYRALDDDARVPHLLIQLQDDLARSRRREAVWISIIVHLVLIYLRCARSSVLKNTFPGTRLSVTKKATDFKDATFLELPPDLQKVPHKPNTNIISDKDRIAMTRHPQLDVKELRKILASPPPGPPGSTRRRWRSKRPLNRRPVWRRISPRRSKRRHLRRSPSYKRPDPTSRASSASMAARCRRATRFRKQPGQRKAGRRTAGRRRRLWFRHRRARPPGGES